MNIEEVATLVAKIQQLEASVANTELELVEATKLKHQHPSIASVHFDGNGESQFVEISSGCYSECYVVLNKEALEELLACFAIPLDIRRRLHI